MVRPVTWDDVKKARRYVAGLPMEDEMSYTKGPWHRETDGSIVADARYVVLAEGFDRGWDENMANAARIVECVNALEGLNPSALADLLEVAKVAAILLDGGTYDKTAQNLKAALAALGVR